MTPLTPSTPQQTFTQMSRQRFVPWHNGIWRWKPWFTETSAAGPEEYLKAPSAPAMRETRAMHYGCCRKKAMTSIRGGRACFFQRKKRERKKKQIKEKETWPLIQRINREPDLGTAQGPAFDHSGPPPGTSSAWKIYEGPWEKYKGSPRVKKMKECKTALSVHVCTWEWERKK